MPYTFKLFILEEHFTDNKNEGTERLNNLLEITKQRQELNHAAWLWSLGI